MAGYPGGNHDGKVHTHVLYHETTGKKVGEVHGGEEGLADKHESKAHERAEPNEQPSHYSDAEKKNFIAGAIKHPGALTRKAKKAGESPMAFAAAHKGDSGTTGKQARLALTLRKLAHHKKG